MERLATLYVVSYANTRILELRIRFQKRMTLYIGLLKLWLTSTWLHKLNSSCFAIQPPTS